MVTLYAARYARALLDVLEASGGEDGKSAIKAGNRDLGEFAEVWHENVPLRNVFLDPSISAAKKIRILDKLNERLGMSKLVRNFLAVILNHERMEAFPEMVSEFERMVRGDLDIDKVEWVSARALGESDRQAVEARIEQLTGRRVEASFREDPALLGGARLRIGSTIYDGSVRGRLNALKEVLASS